MSDLSLRLKIEQLVGSGATDFAISKEFKNHLQRYLSSLDEMFAEDFGRDFLYKHTKELDNFLIEMFRYILRDSFEDYQPLINSIPITIIALGSYGRQELAVYSDIDIMLLYQDIKGYNIKPILERFLYMAWDTGLKVGHRAHEISEVVDATTGDITIKTAILESRFIYGSKFLWTQHQNKLAQIRKMKQKEFVISKLEKTTIRYKKYKLTMEPNIKEGVGGLRDSNTLFWLATAIYGVSSNKELIGTLFNEAEYKEYRVALGFIFKLRNALHLTARKKQDTLYMQIQREIALKLGFEDTKEQSAEVALMIKTFSSMRAINIFASINCAKLSRKIVFEHRSFTELKNARFTKGVFIINNTLYASFLEKNITIFDAIKVILFAQKKGIKSFDYSVHQYLLNSINMQESLFISKKLLFKIFSNETYAILFMLYEIGALSIIIPSFRQVLYLAQFDGYHKYPVDIHTLDSIRCVENIEDLLIKELFDSLSNQEQSCIKIALFFHDIGKGSDMDHSLLGVEIFTKFAQALSFDDGEKKIIKELIKYHTLMPHCAFKKDLNSSLIISNFVKKIKTKKMLDFLYILTYADLNSVGQNIYTTCNAALLKELYIKSVLAIKT